MSIPSPLTRHVDGGMLGFECATFTTHVCMRARVILVEAQKLETSKGRREGHKWAKIRKIITVHVLPHFLIKYAVCTAHQ